MNKILSSLVLIIVMTAFCLPVDRAVAGQVSEPGVLTFTDLGVGSDVVLRGPYDSRDIRFDLPPTWLLLPGAELELEITVFSTGTGVQAENNLIGAVLEVSVNDQLQKSIPLTYGEKITYWVSIDFDSLVLYKEESGYNLSFFLDAAVDCDLDFHETTVIIDAGSKAYFPYEEAPLSPDLQRLPWPIFIENGRVIDPVTVVLPTSPSAEELQAGFVVMGAFARMTNGKVSLTTITVDQVTDALLSQSHLLLVGKPSSFPTFSNLAFPVPLAEGQFSAEEMNADDGILQMLVSPWNKNRVILMVSGNTDQAVVKAAQALSTSNLQTGGALDYSIVAQVNPFPSIDETDTEASVSLSEDIKFYDLGYSFVEVAGIGSHWVSYDFMVPSGQAPSGEVYLDLNISASSLVDTTRSEGVVYVNDIQVGSIVLSSDTSNLINSRIYIPLGAIKQGLNTLDIVFTLLPRDDCSLVTFADMWVMVFPDSNLHLPLAPETAHPSLSTLGDLKAYPSPFIYDPSMGKTTFVLSQQDTNSWLMAGKIAYDLGARVTHPVLVYHVAFDNQIPDELKTNNLILIGEPKNLTILSELKDSMPAYYERESNLAVLESQQVIYRISADKSLGYLQLFTSPWNDQAAILGIFGTTPDGLAFAINALLDPILRGTFAGNFATLEGNRAIVVDTRTGLGIGRIAPGLSPAVVVQEDNPNLIEAAVAANASANYDVSKQLIFSGILVVLGLIALTLIVVLASKLKKRSSGYHRSK